MKKRILLFITLLMLLSISAYSLNDMGKGGSYDGHAVAQSAVLIIEDFLEATEINWGDGVAGSVDTGTPSNPLIHGVDGNCPYANEIPFSGSIGYFFTLTLDDATFPVDVTITLDHVALGYAPGQIGWYVEGFGWTFDPDPWLGVPLAWTNPGTANASVTITITNAKKERADTDVTIAFSGTPDNPLPVILSHFTAVFQRGTSVITWQTQSEENNSHWNLYRSVSQNIGQAIKINPTVIDGAGTTFEPSFYEYTDDIDMNVNEFSYWYWLESVDLGGQTGFFGPYQLEVDLPENENAPEIPKEYGLLPNYPNPFNPTTTIQFVLPEDDFVVVTIFNLKGQKIGEIFRGEIQKDKMLYLPWDAEDKHGNDLRSGIYFVRMETKNNGTFARRLILAK
jgi:hypothetical protein